MPDPTATHRAELDAFLEQWPFFGPFEARCDQRNTTLVITHDLAHNRINAIGAVLELPVREQHDGAGRWSEWYVVVALPTTTLRITTPMIPTQRVEPRDFPRSVAS